MQENPHSYFEIYFSLKNFQFKCLIINDDDMTNDPAAKSFNEILIKYNPTVDQTTSCY